MSLLTGSMKLDGKVQMVSAAELIEMHRAAAEVAALKAEPGKDLLAHGGAS